MPDLTLRHKAHLIDNVWSFEFEARPALEWTAGQFIRIELPHPHPDQEGTKRWFTISAAPFEGNPRITTRITETTFKQALVNLAEGKHVKLLEAPDGDFLWPETHRPRLLIAAGIGITPFRSILAQRAHNGQPLDATLIYANRTGAMPFRDEFDHYATTASGFTVRYLTSGLLTAGRLTELIPELAHDYLMVSGPEPLVEALGDQLRALGIPDDQLQQDFFPNYTKTNY